MGQSLLRMSGTVHVSHHQFFLLDDDTYPEDGGRLFWRDNGLVTTAVGILGIITGIHTGLVNLVVERFASAPPPEVAEWEDIVELDLRAPHAELRVAGLMLDPAPELRIPIPTGSVLCRARVHATGRDTDIDGATMDPFEDYLIQLWDTTTETPANVIRTQSEYGARRRGH